MADRVPLETFGEADVVDLMAAGLKGLASAVRGAASAEPLVGPDRDSVHPLDSMLLGVLGVERALFSGVEPLATPAPPRLADHTAEERYLR